MAKIVRELTMAVLRPGLNAPNFIPNLLPLLARLRPGSFLPRARTRRQTAFSSLRGASAG